MQLVVHRLLQKSSMVSILWGKRVKLYSDRPCLHSHLYVVRQRRLSPTITSLMQALNHVSTIWSSSTNKTNSSNSKSVHRAQLVHRTQHRHHKVSPCYNNRMASPVALFRQILLTRLLSQPQTTISKWWPTSNQLITLSRRNAAESLVTWQIQYC